MKKFLVIMLSLVMAMSLLAGCATKGETYGQLVQLNITEDELNNEVAENSSEESNGRSFVFFDNLSSMLAALESGKIDLIAALPECVAKYIAITNDKFVNESGNHPCDCKFAMGTLAENTETYELLNNAIETLKENGTIEKLQKEYIDNLLENGADPKAVKIETIDGAKTIKVAVTGDLPPVDYVAADGTPAGFNVALLAEISKLANVNIELVQVDSASRLMALTGGTADAIFCFRDLVSDNEELSYLTDDDVPESVSITTEYYTSPTCRLIVK